MRLPIVTRVLLALVVVLSVIVEVFRIWKVALTYEDPDAIPNLDAYYLLLVVGKTPLWALPVTLATTSLVETHILPFLILMVMLATGGRYCEKAWGTRAYANFCVVMLLGTTIYEFLLFWITSEYAGVIVCGANGLVAGITVALKQLVPAHTVVFLKGRIRIPLKWAPTIFLLVVSVLATVGLEENLLAYYTGFLTSWVWLRFVAGDASDAFCFAEFFPDPLSRIVDPIATAMYRGFVALRAVSPLLPDDIEEANQRHAARLAGTLPTALSVRATNERRKMMLRTLES